jgi:hypothetical protein
MICRIPEHPERYPRAGQPTLGSHLLHPRLCTLPGDPHYRRHVNPLWYTICWKEFPLATGRSINWWRICRFGSRSSSAPSEGISQRTAISVRPRRARYACHFRHSTSLLREPSSRLRGGTIQRVGEVRANLDGGWIAG